MTQAGRVFDTVDMQEYVWVAFRGGGAEGSVYLERTFEARSISPGDRVRWEGAWLYWTPRGEPFVDRRLRRIGLPNKPPCRCPELPFSHYPGCPRYAPEG